jgi:hypothetical protein
MGAFPRCDVPGTPLTSVSFRQRRRILIQYLRERTAKM